MAAQNLPDEPTLGYVLHPPHRPQAPGHPRLDIFLRAAPTTRHFDPKSMRLGVASTHKGMVTLTIRHPWRRAADHYRACAGFVSLHDRKNKAVEVYTFGGDLRVTSEDDLTTCTLTSTAPIIDLIPEPLTLGPTVASLLVEEVQALIARQRAAWDARHDPDDFDGRLAAADPLLLYCACLRSLDDKFTARPDYLEDELTRDFTHFLRDEIEALKRTGEWPSSVPQLAELL